MLEKIEGFYLACLRVVVLIAATIALIVFGWACSQGLPFLAAQMGHPSAGAQSPASLSAYIAEQQPAQANGSDASPANTTAALAPAKVAEATRLLMAYGVSHQLTFEAPQLTQVLMSKRTEVADDHRPAYDDSLLAVLRDLAASKGAPLDIEHINGLLDWHLAQFNEAVAAQKASKELAAVKAGASALVGGGALLSFLLIIFFFIFVKIERNLRVVRTQEVAP